MHTSLTSLLTSPCSTSAFYSQPAASPPPPAAHLPPPRAMISSPASQCQPYATPLPLPQASPATQATAQASYQYSAYGAPPTSTASVVASVLASVAAQVGSPTTALAADTSYSDPFAGSPAPSWCLYGSPASAPTSRPTNGATPNGRGGSSVRANGHGHGGGASAALYLEQQAAAKTAFRQIDRNRDGVLSRSEVIKAVRGSGDIRELLGLPPTIRQV